MAHMIWVLGFFLISACTRPPSPVAHHDHDHRDSEYHRDRVRFAAQGREARGIDVTHYFLKGHFDWERQRLVARLEIDLTLLDTSIREIVLDSHVTEIKHVCINTLCPAPHIVEPGKLRLPHLDVSTGTTFKVVIEYETAPGSRSRQSALNAVAPRAGDPIRSRVVFTLSEPNGASDWLPSHNVPSDRAHFTAELTMPVGESLIANGTLEANTVQGQTRTMRYATRYSLPTYLMAFAVGEFTTATQYHGGLPISVVARRGLPVDYEGMLDGITGMMRTFERLIGPYPFEKYAVVVLPEYRGGLENAGITFQGEIGSTQGKVSYDFGLSAHELGHQWFGDYVTVETWDDLWIKEGMATLLAEEATRHFEDTNHAGRLFGRNFGVTAGDAIRDPALAPDDKYTTGPYGRAAWLLTQIRSHVGEEKFWGTLRELLRTHAFDTIGTEEFVRLFEPHLGPAVTERVRGAISAKALPRLEKDAAGGVALTDKHQALVVPLEARWYAADGSHTSELLQPSPSRPVPLRTDALLVLDPRDIHALSAFNPQAVASAFVPTSEWQRELLLGLGANTQIAALIAENWTMEPAWFLPFLAKLPSEEAKYRALQRACAVAAKQSPEAAAAWGAPVARALATPPYYGLPEKGYTEGLSACRGSLRPDYPATRLAEIALDPTSPLVSDLELTLLATLATNADTALDTWGAIILSGSSVRARMLGAMQLVKHVRGVGHYPKPAAANEATWKAFFRRLLDEHETREVLVSALDGAKALRDVEALAAIRNVVQKKGQPVQGNAVCAAYAITKPEPKQWASFVESLGDTTLLDPEVKAILSDPKKCGED